jgi:outer membrane protein assembly factor BamB
MESPIRVVSLSGRTVDQHETETPVARNTTSRLHTLLVMLAAALVFGPILIFIVGFVQWARTDQARWFYHGLDGMQWYLLIALVLAVTSIIGMVVFRPRLRTLATITSVGILVLFAASQVLRLESFRGDRTPRFVWKWTPTAEQEVKRYLISHSTRAVSSPRLAPERFAPTGDDYPGFMGPDRNAQVISRNLSKRWDKRPPRLLWRHPVGLGWAGFAVQGGVAVTLEQRDEEECSVCYDLKTGNELWVHAELLRFRNEHGDGPRTTPWIQGDRVYCCGGTGMVTCVDLATGDLVWKADLLADAGLQPPYFGWSCSPLVSGSELIVTPGIQPGGTIVALDLETGSERWRGGDDATSYASPVAATLCGQLQFLSFNGEGLRAFARGGKDLWFHPWLTQGESRVNVAQPVIVERGSSTEPARIVISSGYDMGTSLLSVRQIDGSWHVETVWKSRHLKSKFSNCLIYRDHIYGLDNGLLTCLRLADGERTWKKGRYGHGQLLLVDGRLLIQCESGEIAMVEANPELHVELARFRALEDKTWNHPALAGNILLVRNDREAGAYELQTIVRLD